MVPSSKVQTSQGDRKSRSSDGLMPLVMDNTVAQSVRATVPIQETVIRVDVVHVVHETFAETCQHSSETKVRRCLPKGIADAIQSCELM